MMKGNETALEYVEPRLTRSRLTDDVMSAAMERRGYGDAVTFETARDVAFFYLSGRAVWDEALDAFCRELVAADFESMADSEDRGLTAFVEAQFLAHEVQAVLYEQDASAYAHGINRDTLSAALEDAFSFDQPCVRPDYLEHVALLVASLVVGGRNYVENECQCELDAYHLTVDDVIAVADGLKEH